jgi:hypothetical protein
LGKEPIKDTSVTVDAITLKEANLNLSGIVVDANGNAVEAAKVHCWGNGQPELRTRTDPEGKFSIENICQGKLRIQARKGRLSGVIDTEGGEGNVRIVLSKARVFSRTRRPSRKKETPLSLLGKSLSKLETIGIQFDTVKSQGKRILICFWDMNQRPSRHVVRELGKRAERLRERGFVLLCVQVSKVEKDKFEEWVKQNKVASAFAIVEVDEEKLRNELGVKSLPWLILTDKNHIVKAEGFGIEELDKEMSNQGKLLEARDAGDDGWGEEVNGIRARIWSKGSYILSTSSSNVYVEVENLSEQFVEISFPPEYCREEGRGWWEGLRKVEVIDANGGVIRPTWRSPKPYSHTLAPGSKYRRPSELSSYFFDFDEPGKYKTRFTYGVQPLGNNKTFKVNTNWLEFDVVLTDHVPGTPYTAEKAFKEAQLYDSILLSHGKISKAQCVDKYLALAREYPGSKYELLGYYWASVVLSQRPVYPDKPHTSEQMKQARDFWRKIILKWPDLVLEETLFARHNLAFTDKNRFESLLDFYAWLTSRTPEQRVISVTKWIDYYPNKKTVAEKVELLDKELKSRLDSLERRLTSRLTEEQSKIIQERFPNTHLAELAGK